jgi:hypothetical protein
VVVTIVRHVTILTVARVESNIRVECKECILMM